MSRLKRALRKPVPQRKKDETKREIDEMMFDVDSFLLGLGIGK